MRVLVTGGAGFIRSHTAETLLAGGYYVRVLDGLQPLNGVRGAYHVPAYPHEKLEVNTKFALNTVSTALLCETTVSPCFPVGKVILAFSRVPYPREGRISSLSTGTSARARGRRRGRPPSWCICGALLDRRWNYLCRRWEAAESYPSTRRPEAPRRVDLGKAAGTR